jgi:hypothetical protein
MNNLRICVNASLHHCGRDDQAATDGMPRSSTAQKDKDMTSTRAEEQMNIAIANSPFPRTCERQENISGGRQAEAFFWPKSFGNPNRVVNGN